MGLPTSRLRKRLLLVMFVFMLGVTGGCKQAPWTLWESYSTRFIDAQGRVIDPQGGSRTTSEGQSYALFFSLVNNDRARFDQVLAWTQNNLAESDMRTHLPGWLWGRSPEGEWKLLDPNSASDSDVWIAYDLLEAGRLWGQPHYTAIARGMLSLISAHEVANLPGFGPMLLPGPFGFQHGDSWTLNPSYLPLFVFERFAVADPAGPWRQIALRIPRLLEQSARHGFAMDWVDYTPNDGFYPAPAHPGKDANNPVGSYDAIRVYLWAGMLDGGKRIRAELLNALPGMNVYLANHDAPPEKVSDRGIPLAQDGPVGFSAALLPYLRAFPGNEPAAARQTVRVGAQRDSSTGLYGKDLAYYDQNLVLFATGYIDGRFRFDADGALKVEWAHG